MRARPGIGRYHVTFAPKRRKTLPMTCFAVYLSPFSRRHLTPPHALRAGQVTNIPARYAADCLRSAASRLCASCFAWADPRAFSLAETSEFGIARIIVKDVYKTTTVLRDAGYIHSLSEVIAVAIPDVPGGLYNTMKLIADAGINLEYMYCFLGGKTGKAYMICKVADAAAAEAVLRCSGALLADQEELSEL